MAAYRETNRKDWTDIIVRLALMFLVMFVVGALLGPANLLLWPVVLLGPLFGMILWHTRNFAYRCRNCDNLFEITFWQNMLTPHSPDGKGGGWKYVKCPRCKNWSRAQALRIERGQPSRRFKWRR